MLLDKCEVAWFTDTDFIAPWLKLDAWFSRLQLNLTWDTTGNVESCQIMVSYDERLKCKCLLLTLLEGVTEHCICNAFYRPHQDAQRYCQLCKRWYDEKCMNERAEGNPSFEYESGQEARLSDVASLPIVRGSHAFGMKENKWSVFGTGRRIVAARELLSRPGRNDEVDRMSMAKKIGFEFVTLMFEKEWLWYKCPRCSIPI